MATESETPAAKGAALALVGAALIGGLGAYRASSHGAPPGLAYLVAAGGSATLLLPAAVALRILRPLGQATIAVLLGAWLALGPLAVFGTQLAQRTHHRPLAGATFAFVALGVLVLCTVLSLRLLQLRHSEHVLSRRLAGLGLVSAAGGALLVDVWILWSGLSAAGGGTTAAVTDAAVVSLLGLAAAWLPLRAWRFGRRALGAALFLWVTLIIAASFAFSAAGSGLGDASPALLGVLWIFAR